MEINVINRAVAIIKPQAPYLEWANGVAQSYESLEDLVKSSRAILVPNDAYDGMETFLKKNFSLIFELELESWVSDNHNWPPKRDYDTFTKWFDVEAYALVVDLSEAELLREPYGG